MPPSTAGSDSMDETLLKSTDSGETSSEALRFGSCTCVGRLSHADAKLESEIMGIRRDGRG